MSKNNECLDYGYWKGGAASLHELLDFVIHVLGLVTGLNLGQQVFVNQISVPTHLVGGCYKTLLSQLSAVMR